ncbi:MAG: hypothetical protein K2Z81_21365 [Cyanobacteria bacterium]|nr:hypothetical protein [Cyanobacteriota bacterium]
MNPGEPIVEREVIGASNQQFENNQLISRGLIPELFLELNGTEEVATPFFHFASGASSKLLNEQVSSRHGKPPQKYDPPTDELMQIGLLRIASNRVGFGVVSAALERWKSNKNS